MQFLGERLCRRVREKSRNNRTSFCRRMFVCEFAQEDENCCEAEEGGVAGDVEIKRGRVTLELAWRLIGRRWV